MGSMVVVTAVTSSQAEPGVPARSGLGLASADSWVRRQCQRRDPMMGAENKAANKVTEIKGKIKKKAGQATDDADLEAKGRAEESKGDLKQAGEKAKDAFKR